MPERDANQLTEPCGACGKSPAWHQGWTDDGSPMPTCAECGSPPVRDANQLAADATEAIDNLSRIVGEHRVGPSGGTTGGWYAITVLKAALDELVALVGTLQQERDAQKTAHAAIYRSWSRERERAEAAEAQVAALTQQLGHRADACVREADKVLAAEAALATTRQALAAIAKRLDTPRHVAVELRALADTGGDTAPACDHDYVWTMAVPGYQCQKCGALSSSGAVT